MKLSQIVETLETIAPARFAESWDNVGLLVGDPRQEITAGMLTIDYTPEVACEAAGAKCDFILAYHPPIFGGLKRIISGGSSAAVYDAIKRGVAIYSPHTALDIAPGGTNDMLADAIGLTERRPLKPLDSKPAEFKLITFLPAESLEKVSQALFAAGAGRIGNYTSCSFRTDGTGTFFGEEGTDPAVGKAGKLESVPETRLEMVVPTRIVDRVVAALRASHPYEEPAFDLVQIAAPPTGLGMGRIGTMPPAPRAKVIERIKQALGIEHLLVAGPTDGEITTAAVCAGACGDMLDEVIAQKAGLYLTGEMRHHDALKAARAGVTVVCVLHSNSERAVLKRLAADLSKRLAQVAWTVSAKDRDPFAVL